MMRTWLCILCLCPWLPCGAASVRLLNGETHEGSSAMEDRAIIITPPEAEPVKIDPSEIIEARFGTPTRDPDVLAPGVVLSSGSNIAGKIESLDEPELKVGSLEVPVPMRAVAAILFRAVPHDQVFKRTDPQPGGLLVNGDFFAGTFTGIQKDRVIINSLFFGPRRFTPGGLAALLLQEITQHPARYEVGARDGSRFMADELRIEAQGLLLREPLLGQVRIPSADVVEIRAGSSRYQPLTGIDPVRVDVPDGGPREDALQIQAAAGEGAQPIIVTGANVSVSYTVPPGMNTFSCAVAVPEDAPAHVRLTFAVYAEGRLLGRSPTREPGQSPAPVKVALRDARTIILRAEPASPGSGTASGHWLVPAFLRL